MNPYPKLRVKVRKGRDGRIRTYYSYDMRGTGQKDVALGTDHDEAIKAWEELHLKKPRIKGTLEEAFQRWEQDELPKYKNKGTAKGYRTSLAQLRKFKVGQATWDGVKFSDLKGYLNARAAKVQANRELSLLQVIWNWARGAGLTEIQWPAAGMEKARWKNPEEGRTFKVSDALFAAIYSEADQTLRDCMDLATATGMRLTDCRHILVPSGNTLNLKASKTGKSAEFDVSSSPILSGLVERRRALTASHLMLLSTPSGKPVSATMLRDRYDAARAKAAARPENAAIADQIRAMYLRDCRKRASDLAGSMEEASKLLQHSSMAVTSKHYRSKPVTLKPVR